MQLPIASVGKNKHMWSTAAWLCATAAFVAALAFAVKPAGASGVTFVVDEDGFATSNNCGSSTPTPYSTISSAVTAAAAGDTVKVCPGAYTEDLMLNKAITLKGAKADKWVGDRTFMGPNESSVTGLVTVAAADVKVDGFSFTNPGQGTGVLVKVAGDNAVIKDNFVDTVGSVSFLTPTVGIYLERGPDNVKVADNQIGHVMSQGGSAQGILVGDSVSTNPSLDIRLDDNIITDMTSATRGAYGIQVNNGSSNADPSYIGYAEVKIRGNTIKNLSGNWAHGIGLEGETPDVVVEYNRISDLTDVNPVPAADMIGVFFEDNPFFFTGEVNHNRLDVSATGYGIAVANALTTHYPSLNVDGECNWWGAADGPGAVGTGSGSLVTTNVDFKPWLKSAKLNKDCDHDGHNGHHNNWKNDDDNWHNDD